LRHLDQVMPNRISKKYPLILFFLLSIIIHHF
jgi:hypothetical protein